MILAIAKLSILLGFGICVLLLSAFVACELVDLVKGKNLDD